MFRVLSLAGGGLRGAFAIGVLAEFERQLGSPLSDYFDLIAGTSTGSITSSALAYGMSASDVEAFYNKHSEAIFHARDRYTPKAAIAWFIRYYAGLPSRDLESTRIIFSNLATVHSD